MLPVAALAPCPLLARAVVAWAAVLDLPRLRDERPGLEIEVEKSHRPSDSVPV